MFVLKIIFRHNTQGRYCSDCKDLYYREVSKSLYDENVCTPCNCYGPGLQSDNFSCAKVSYSAKKFKCGGIENLKRILKIFLREAHAGGMALWISTCWA